MFFEMKSVHNESKSKSKVLNDVANHTKDWERMMVRGSLTTSAHEASHQVHADIRNDRIVIAKMGEKESLGPDGLKLWQPDPTFDRPKMGPGDNGFYLLEDKAFKCKSPKLRKSKAAEFIPQLLRGFRFNTYITGQTAWDDTPLYIFDEWAAYHIGTSCAIELHKIGDTSPRGTDISSGPIEFTMYSLGLVLAINKYDKDFFQREPDFMKFVSYMTNKAIALAKECNQYFPWDATTKYLDMWNSDICKPYRALIETRKLTLDDFAQG